MKYFLMFLLLNGSLLFSQIPNNELSLYIHHDELTEELWFYVRQDELKFDQGKEFIEDANFDNEYMFISLGSHCQTAAQLNHYGLRNGSFPFDWLLSDSTDNVTALLYNDFQNFFDEKYLHQNPNTSWWLDNPLYKFEFRHEWPFQSVPVIGDERLKAVIATTKIKYARRIDRFKKLKNFKGKVFFIRTASCLDGDYFWAKENSFNKAIPELKAQKLRDGLRYFFPNLKFDLIIINYTEKNDESINKWSENIFELKVASRNTHGYVFFKHVFDFIETLRQPV